MKAIVTGAKGFIGSALCKELKAQGVEVAEIDLGDKIEDLSGEYDVFYHLAWVGKAGPKRADWRIQLGNVEMALKYFEEAKRLQVKRFVCAGTIGEKMLELPECAKLKSQNALYVNSKLYLHHLLNVMSDEKCRVIWATLGNMYGCGAAGGSVIDYALQTVLKDEDAIFGPGTQPYDFVNVEDAIRGLAGIGLSEEIQSDEFYVGTGKPRLLKEWLTEVGELAGKSERIKIGGRPNDGTRFKVEWFSIENLTRETGYQPRIEFKDGIKANIEYLKGR